MAQSNEEPRASTPVDVEKGDPKATVQNEAEDEFPGWRRVVVIMAAVYLSMFLVALVSQSNHLTSHKLYSYYSRIEPS